MRQRLSELDESYWSFNSAQSEDRHRKFLEQLRMPGEYVVDGLTFTCAPTVYHPHEFSSTRFVLHGLIAASACWGKHVLEIGTGTGTIGICLAARGHQVTMVDIDPLAVACARDNAARNHVAVEIYESDLFAAVGGQRYELIIFNTPLKDQPIHDPVERVFCDDNGALLKRFMQQAKHHLAPGGYICISLSNIGNRAAILNALVGYDDTLIHAEYDAATREWRWLLRAQPVAG